MPWLKKKAHIEKSETFGEKTKKKSGKKTGKKFTKAIKRKSKKREKKEISKKTGGGTVHGEKIETKEGNRKIKGKKNTHTKDKEENRSHFVEVAVDAMMICRTLWAASRAL